MGLKLAPGNFLKVSSVDKFTLTQLKDTSFAKGVEEKGNGGCEMMILLAYDVILP